MKINGESINADYLSFHFFNDGTARLALDHNKGALLIRYDWAEMPEETRFYMSCSPEDIVFNAEGVGRAHFKQGWRDDPDTHERTWSKPSIPCRVEKVPYTDEEQKQYEAKKSQREAQKIMLEEEKQRAEKAREQAELDRRSKLAMIALAERAGSEPGKQTRKPRVEWPSTAQGRIADIWKDWKKCHNTQETGGRELDCYNENKADMPDTVKTFADFRACKECARKNGRIPKYNRKRRKSAG